MRRRIGRGFGTFQHEDLDPDFCTKKNIGEMLGCVRKALVWFTGLQDLEKQSLESHWRG